MDSRSLTDTHIESSQLLPSPMELVGQLPLTDASARTVIAGRQAIANIIDGHDSRKFIVVGPCSIHDVKAALDYAARLKTLADRVQDKILIIMRVYFEKPRTTVGWKGLINDPFLDGSFHIEKGLFTARQLLIQIGEIGLPAGTEALDPISPQYLSDLVSWYAIGARTIESQTHREMASGLSVPVGLKNGTDGNIKVAVDALEASRTPHHFLGMNPSGQVSIFRTKGNPYGHIILRGGGGKPNYDPDTIQWLEDTLTQRNLPVNIVVDCSHGNSNKDHTRQGQVVRDLLKHIKNGHQSIVGMMLESNIHAGNQKIPADLNQLKYGVSITDKCISWSETEELILGIYDALPTAKVPVGSLGV
ncbi:MAG: 3-deoxy-7-phosphoheptulonate synthase [Merismopedia sp. SIO2A8]|nr:3-deoxy-7-phosphoheptulonate synthase [Symploca sp. SIO2B6]NET51055.1 3-deoxy-7-phosphoheptulonate synthase [Merismopedia sp. SIO2A8]